MSIAARLSVAPIVRYHFRGLRASGDSRLPRRDQAILVVPPTAAAVCSYVSGLQLVGVSPLISATALLVGAMLTVFVFLTNLRIKVSESAKYDYKRTLQRMIGRAAVGALYVACLSLLVTAGLGVGAAAQLSILNDLQLRRAGSALTMALLVHLALNLLAVIRSTFAVYYEVFGVDFGASLEPVTADEGEVVLRRKSN